MFVPVSQHIFHVLNLPLQLSRHNSLLWSCATKMTISKTNRPGPGSIREMGQYGKWVFSERAKRWEFGGQEWHWFCHMWAKSSHNNCSLAGCYGEWRAPASVTSPVWRNPIHRNPFLIINQIHKYTQMTHTFFVTYECTKLLCVSPTRFYHDCFSFKENTYPVLNQRHISVDIRTAPFFTGANHARSRFSKPNPITRKRNPCMGFQTAGFGTLFQPGRLDS